MILSMHFTIKSGKTFGLLTLDSTLYLLINVIPNATDLGTWTSDFWRMSQVVYQIQTILLLLNLLDRTATCLQLLQVSF